MNERPRPSIHAPPHELGFDTRVMHTSEVRLLNRDGSFNISREGLPFIQSLHVYHSLLTMPWWRFNLLLIVTFLAVNVVFSLVYLTLGTGAITGGMSLTVAERFWEALYLSVYTITTIGYGNLVPNGIPANLIASLEGFLGLSGFAVAAGLIFARVSRPLARIRFSDVAVITTDASSPTLKFRIVNAGQNELLDVDVRILMAITETAGGLRVRHFHDLPVERNRVAFFPLDWTVVHHIDEASPLHNLSREAVEESNAEFLVLINAIDDTAAHVVQARSSYRCNELRWDQQFVDMFHRKSDGSLAVDLRRLHDVTRAGAAAGGRETVWDF